jgi:hypothetical protein
MILKYFRRKFQQKKLAFLTQNKAKLCKNLIITLVFEKNVNFFAENSQKSQKIVIITSTPVPNPTTLIYNTSIVKIYDIRQFCPQRFCPLVWALGDLPTRVKVEGFVYHCRLSHDLGIN